MQLSHAVTQKTESSFLCQCLGYQYECSVFWINLCTQSNLWCLPQIYFYLFSRRLYHSRISREHSQSSKIKILKNINVEEVQFRISPSSIREITFREQEAVREI